MPTLRLKIPPVVVVLIAGTVMWLCARATPTLQLALPAKRWLAAGFLLAGIAVIALGVAAFHRARTTLNPLQPHTASTIVSAGIYRVTRNPMYLGLLLMLTARALVLAHPFAFAVLPGFVLYMNRFQIAPEEAALTNLFGVAYADYRKKVRRWL